MHFTNLFYMPNNTVIYKKNYVCNSYSFIYNYAIHLGPIHVKYFVPV